MPIRRRYRTTLLPSSLLFFLMMFSAVRSPLYSSQENPHFLHLEGKERMELLRPKTQIAYTVQDRVWVLTVLAVTEEEIAMHIVEGTKDSLEREGLSSWFSWSHAGHPSSLSDFYVSIPRARSSITITNNGQEDDFATRLLKILFQETLRPIPMHERKRIGPPPLPGELDVRKVWNPPLFFHGESLGQPPADAYTLVWPMDGSDLQGREFTLYYSPKFQEEKSSRKAQGNLPTTALPLWIESKGGKLFVARAIDSAWEE